MLDNKKYPCYNGLRYVWVEATPAHRAGVFFFNVLAQNSEKENANRENTLLANAPALRPYN